MAEASIGLKRKEKERITGKPGTWRVGNGICRTATMLWDTLFTMFGWPIQRPRPRLLTTEESCSVQSNLLFFFFNIYLMHSTSRKQLVCVPVTTEPFQSIQTNGCSLNRQEKDKHVSYNMLFLVNSLSNYKFLGPQGQKVRPTMHDPLLVCGQDQCPSFICSEVRR